jgi:DNA-binding NtrC family response regulator
MFEEASGGTLFLDEVGNLSLGLQVKLLQFFNDFTITRVGGTRPIKLDVRCILASNTSLEAMVRAGTFREDLFYRIRVISVRLPPLKDRREDIPVLCSHFLRIFNEENKKQIRAFAPQTLKKLEAHDWPGNIRELRNVVYRAVIYCNGDTITEELVQFPEQEGPSARTGQRKKPPPFKLALTDKKYIQGLFKKHFGSVTEMARELGITRRTLYNYIAREKIDINAFRRGFGSGLPHQD